MFVFFLMCNLVLSLWTFIGILRETLQIKLYMWKKACCVNVMIFLPVLRVSAGCRWRPSASACLRCTPPSSSCCRRRRTPTHTLWSWNCGTWAITLTTVSRCVVGVHLCLRQSRVMPLIHHWWWIRTEQNSGWWMYLALFLSFVGYSVVVRGCEKNYSINSSFLFFQMSQKSSNTTTCYKLYPKNAVRSFR